MTLILLPPSETKRDGGEPARASGALRFAELTDARREVRDALRGLMAGEDDEAIARAVKVGRTAAAAEIARNRSLDGAPVMPAIDRYTGVLYDALDAESLDAGARQLAGRSVVIQSALFGPVGALDAIPAYRLSADSRLPGLRLKAVWSRPASEALLATGEALVDLRSASYAALAPVPATYPGDNAVTVSVVARGADGAVRALNHFNKRGKGLFVRALLQSGTIPDSVDGLCAHAQTIGWELTRLSAGELQLVVPQS